MHKILAVEDSDEFQQLILRTLGDYKVTICGTAEEAAITARNTSFDLILVDITLPKRDGYSLVSELQADTQTSNIPILCLTGRTGLTDKVTAFSLGADDYITKPFDPIELRARVEARLRKKSKAKQQSEITVVGDIEIDHGRHRIAVGTDSDRGEVSVTQTEFKILSCLARRPDQVFTRDQLLVAAWGDDATVLERVVDVHVCLLRKKLGTRSQYIKAIPGVGYKLSPTQKKNKVA